MEEELVDIKKKIRFIMEECQVILDRVEKVEQHMKRVRDLIGGESASGIGSRPSVVETEPSQTTAPKIKANSDMKNNSMKSSSEHILLANNKPSPAQSEEPSVWLSARSKRKHYLDPSSCEKILNMDTQELLDSL